MANMILTSMSKKNSYKQSLVNEENSIHSQLILDPFFYLSFSFFTFKYGSLSLAMAMNLHP